MTDENKEKKLRWYVIQAFSGFEKRVAQTIKEHIKIQGLEDSFGEVLVPTEEVVEMRAGQKRKSERKFFPGYMLIKMIMTDKAWHLVKNTDKITGFVGGSSVKPQPISDEEAAFMLGQAKDGAAKKARSSVAYSTGDSVKVVEGPFASFVGTVEAVNANGKLKVNVSIFGRPTPVELDDTQVEKA